MKENQLTTLSVSEFREFFELEETIREYKESIFDIMDSDNTEKTCFELLDDKEKTTILNVLLKSEFDEKIWKKAADHFEKVLKNDENNNIFNTLTDIYILLLKENNNYENFLLFKASEHLEKALNKDKNNTKILSILAAIYIYP